MLASFEPRRSENPTRSHFAQKPTNNGGKALLRPRARPSNATSKPATPARDALSGHYVRRGLGNLGTGGDMPDDALRLHLERVVPALPERVYALNTEPELLARWWGPNGFSVPSVEVDARVGGRYRIEMQPPEGDSFGL